MPNIKKASEKEIQQHLQGYERVQANLQNVMFTLAKFLRTNSGFINKNDYNAVDELVGHLNEYMLHDPYLVSTLNKLYRKRKLELNELDKKEMMYEELLNQDVPKAILRAAKVSKTEFEEIKMLLKFDKDIFQLESEMHPRNDLLLDNPFSFFVNFDRLPSKIPEKIKQYLYRPERMARLKSAFHRLALELK